jgi:hypothetical protein
VRAELVQYANVKMIRYTHSMHRLLVRSSMSVPMMTVPPWTFRASKRYSPPTSGTNVCGVSKIKLVGNSTDRNKFKRLVIGASLSIINPSEEKTYQLENGRNKYLPIAYQIPIVLFINFIRNFVGRFIQLRNCCFFGFDNLQKHPVKNRRLEIKLPTEQSQWLFSEYPLKAFLIARWIKGIVREENHVF